MKSIFKIIETETHQILIEKTQTECMCKECKAINPSLDMSLDVSFQCKGLRNGERLGFKRLVTFDSIDDRDYAFNNVDMDIIIKLVRESEQKISGLIHKYQARNN